MNITVTKETREALVHLIKTLKVGPFVSAEEQALIMNKLNLSSKSIDELRDTRNQVVKVCADVNRIDCENGDWTRFDKVANLMSKTTATIDHHAMKLMGGQR